jgi:hypothetical protein
VPEPRGDLSAGHIVDVPRFAHKARFSYSTEEHAAPARGQAESGSSAHDYSVGIRYSMHFTISPSTLTSIAELISSFPASYRMACLDRWTDGTTVRDDYDQAGVQLHFAEEAHQVDAVIRDEREFILDDSVGQFPARITAQTEMVDVSCFETTTMSDSNQPLMQAFVDQEPHALLRKVLSE